MKQIIRKRTQQGAFHALHGRGLLLVLLALLAFGALYCTPPDPNAGYRFLCEKARDGWKLCNQNRVRYCHVDHFHTGQSCEQQGFECVEVGEKNAVCVDKTKTCKAGESKCEKNTAYNCTDGAFSVEPCGTAKECEIKDKKAACKHKVEVCNGKGELHDGKCECDAGHKPDPKDNRSCIPE